MRGLEVIERHPPWGLRDHDETWNSFKRIPVSKLQDRFQDDSKFQDLHKHNFNCEFVTCWERRLVLLSHRLVFLGFWVSLILSLLPVEPILSRSGLLTLVVFPPHFILTLSSLNTHLHMKNPHRFRKHLSSRVNTITSTIISVMNWKPRKIWCELSRHWKPRKILPEPLLSHT